MKIVPVQQHVPRTFPKGRNIQQRKKTKKKVEISIDIYIKKWRQTNCHRILKESGQCRLLTLACLTASDALLLDSISQKREKKKRLEMSKEDGVASCVSSHPTCSIAFRSIQHQIGSPADWISFIPRVPEWAVRYLRNFLEFGDVVVENCRRPHAIKWRNITRRSFNIPRKSQKRGDVNGRLSTFNDGEANLDSHQTQSAPDEFYRNFFPITALFFFVSLTDVLQ